MTRSLWKGPYVSASVLKLAESPKKKNIQIWSRASVIPGFLIGQTVLVYNGKEFKKNLITRDKIGFKFGEFSFTRKYINKQKTSKKNNKR